MVHAFSIVASRIGAAGYKLMRSSHETWTSSQDPLTTREPKNRKTGNAQPTKTALTATGPYKQTSGFAFDFGDHPLAWPLQRGIFVVPANQAEGRVADVDVNQIQYWACSVGTNRQVPSA
jgi:hypothetical protein